MRIDLTDHLRCPGDHPESFLVLLPDRMEGRDVAAGHLGCPVCGWSTDWTDSVPRFDARPSVAEPFPLDADGAAALLGLGGPGGWIAIGGAAGGLAPELAEALPGVGVVAINPPVGVRVTPSISLLQAERWPIKRHALRGVLLSREVSDWWHAALQSVLPGLRLVGVGSEPAGVELVASAGGVWVVQRGAG